MSKACFISVVRDFDLYNRVSADNPHLGDVQKVAFDNREENRPIPARYNEFLDGYDYSKPTWFVFCHEDFEPLEPLEPLLEWNNWMQTVLVFGAGHPCQSWSYEGMSAGWHG